MSIFKRLFTMGKAEANSAIDKLEDPIKLTEQGIRDMKKDLEESLKALAEVKAMAIKARNEISTEKERGKDYEKKAMLILQKGGNGGMDASEADRLATETLNKKSECESNVARLSKDQDSFEGNVSKLERNVKDIRSKVSKWENELKTLKARVKVASATKKLNKQMSQIDSTDTVSMLERMKDKVAEEESLAEAYGDIANESRSLDDELDKAIGNDNPDATADLAALKAKMGLDK